MHDGAEVVDLGSLTTVPIDPVRCSETRVGLLGEARVPECVTAPHRVDLVLGEPTFTELAQRFQEPVPRLMRGSLREHHRPLDESDERVLDVEAIGIR